jgi:hypothetical protein
MSITVKPIVKPRHSTKEWALDACREYQGAIGYEASFQYSVDLDETDAASNAAGNTLWVRQRVIAMHFFRDASRSLCVRKTAHVDEFFSIGRTSKATMIDLHHASHPTFGRKCVRPCYQYGIVIASLSIVTCKDQWGNAYVASDPDGSEGQEYGCQSGTIDVETHGDKGTTVTHGNLDGCEPASSPDRNSSSTATSAQAIPEVDQILSKYGAKTYHYTYGIDHCFDKWNFSNPRRPPPAVPPPADDDSPFGTANLYVWDDIVSHTDTSHRRIAVPSSHESGSVLFPFGVVPLSDVSTMRAHGMTALRSFDQT